MKGASGVEDLPPFLPVFLNLSGKCILVAGGDASSAAKAQVFAEAGARVTLASIQTGPEALALAPRVKILRRGWLFSDVMECALVCAGPKISVAMVERLAGAAAACNAMFYAVDRPQYSDFSSGAYVRRGALSVGISTAGAAPALGQAVRRELERLLPEALGAYVHGAALVRADVGAKLNGAGRRKFWAQSADDAFAAMQRNCTLHGAEAWSRWLGERLSQADVEPKRSVVVIPAPDDADDLTLAQARALSRADIVFICAGASRAALALLRREAEQRDLPEACAMPDVACALPAGANVVILAGLQTTDNAAAFAKACVGPV